MEFKNFWEVKPPDFINEEGVKWWLDESSTKYATKENHHGISLDARVYVIQFPDNKVLTRVLIVDNRVVYETQSLEAMAVHIDMLKFLELDRRREATNGR